MTKVTLEVELDLETSYRPGRGAKLNPPPGEPPEPEEIEIIHIDRLVVESQEVPLCNIMQAAFLEDLLANKEIRSKIEEQVREQACG